MIKFLPSAISAETHIKRIRQFVTAVLILTGSQPAAADTDFSEFVDPHPSIPGAVASCDKVSQSVAISMGQLGTEIGKRYTGEGVGIIKTGEGARLRVVMQDLVAEATPTGLEVVSATIEDANAKSRFRVRAVRIGREGTLSSLPDVGEVHFTPNLVSNSRPGLVEEYSVSPDGIRQDFLVIQRPAGNSELIVGLKVEGADAFPASYGAKLVVHANQREIAYNRLHVTDATGRILDASIAVPDTDCLAICVDDAGANYPIRIDPTFSDADWLSLNPGLPGLDGDVYAVATTAAGEVYVGGYFSVAGTVAARGIAKWDGNSWSAVGGGVNGIVYALRMIGSDLYAGGIFSTAGTVAATNAAKWDGSTWSALGLGVDRAVYELTSNGNDLYAGGAFRSAGGVPALRIAKWNGSAWSPLGSGLNNEVWALTIHAGEVYAGGTFTTAGGVPAIRIAKWDGSAWSAVGSGISRTVWALASFGGELWAGSDFLSRWNGTVWSHSDFSIDRLSTLTATATHLYAGGDFTSIGGNYALNLARWDGTSWAHLGQGVGGDYSDSCFAIAVNGSDVFAAGSFQVAGGRNNNIAANNVAKWDGDSWSGLGFAGLNNDVLAFAEMDGTMYAGGRFYTASGSSVNGVAKWNGSMWLPLGIGLSVENTGGILEVNSMVAMGGDLYVAGVFVSAGGTTAQGIAKWNGSAWSALSTSQVYGIEALAVIGNDLYAAGSFTSIGGVAANSIAKWNGTAWSPLGSGLDGSNSPKASTLATDGTNLYVGGRFQTAGGLPIRGIAKWNGTAWSAMGGSTTADVGVLTYGGGHLYAAMSNSGKIGGVSIQNYMAKWDGSTWSSMGSGLTSGGHALTYADGEIFAGGTFGLQRWNGSEWAALGSEIASNKTIYALAVSHENQLFVGGDFAFVGTKVSPFVALANLNGTPILTIEQPATVNIANGSAPIVFDPVAVGDFMSRTFVVRNTGTADLSGISVTGLEGFEVDFTVATPPDSTLIPDDSTSFTLTFAPSAVGIQNTMVSIASNDPNENPFLINLTGVGVTALAAFDNVVATNSTLTGNDALPDAIPYGDEVPNILKYAFNMDLTASDSTQLTPGGSTGLPTASLVEEGGQTYYRVEYLRRRGSGLIYTPKKSSILDPNSFVPLTGTPNVQAIENDSEWERVWVDEPCDAATASRCFSLVEVTFP